MKVYGLVPVFNEEKNIRETIKKLKLVGIFPIIINDGSTDGTKSICSKLKCKVLHHNKNKGKAESIKTGLKYLKNYNYDFLVLIDGDMQFLPEESKNLLEPLIKRKADFVMGYRNFENIPYLRHKISNFIWKTTFNIFFGTKFKDTNCGFIALNKKAAKILEKKMHGGYILENFMLSEMILNKIRIYQVPVKIKYSRKSDFKRGLKILFEVFFYILYRGIKFRLRIK